MKALLIAEKPSAMRDMQAVYKKHGFKDQIDFMCARGHLLALYSPEEYNPDWKKWSLNTLPMIPDKFKYKVTGNFKKSSAGWKYQEDADAKKRLAELKKALQDKSYDYVINAADPAREGELIFKTIYHFSKSKLPVKRLWPKDLTDKGILNALNDLRDDAEFKPLEFAARYRQAFDWLVGMNLSRALSLRSDILGAAVGRVMTPTLLIVAKREWEIANFKPVPYWMIEADLGSFSALWFDPDKKENSNRIDEKKKAQSVQASVKDQLKVLSVEKKKHEENAPTLYSLGDLQKDANRAFGFPLDKTLSLAQSLYEKHKVLTYPRTDSKYLSSNLANIAEKHIGALSAIKGLDKVTAGILSDAGHISKTMKSKRYVDDNKVTDHHAIIPTDLSPAKMSGLVEKLSSDERKVFNLVAARFLSIFLPPKISEKTTAVLSDGQNQFLATGNIILQLGFRALVKTKSAENELPQMKKGDVFDVKKTEILERETKAPPRYTDSSLLGAMENAGKHIDKSAPNYKELIKTLKDVDGIGTPATRASIVEKLVKKNLIRRKGKQFYLEELGDKMSQMLKNFEIASPELTGEWEKKLNLMKDRKYDPMELYREIIAFTKKATADFINSNEIKKVPRPKSAPKKKSSTKRSSKK